MNYIDLIGKTTNKNIQQTLINKIGFYLKEGNAFAIVNTIYSTKYKSTYTKDIGKRIQESINDIQKDDFVLYQTPIEVYKQKAHKEIIERNGKKYEVWVVNSNEIENLYAVVHNTNGVSGIAKGNNQQQAMEKLKTLKNADNTRVYCGAYISNENLCSIGEGFIFVVPNDKIHVAVGHDMGSKCKNLDAMLDEYYTNNEIVADTQNHANIKETKTDERKMVSKNLKEIMNISDEEYAQKIIRLKAKLQGRPLTQELLEEFDPQMANAYKIFYSRTNNNGDNGLSALLRDGKDREWNEVLVSHPTLAGIVTPNLSTLSTSKLEFAAEEGLPIMVLNRR